ncbi:hypothetical protein VVMO6_03323 [Vibrio vulnificus MO6-24/O]|nr:hypothetical protein VVMO6_03323 [Vibrio vulnificus MO6-24/O]
MSFCYLFITFFLVVKKIKDEQLKWRVEEWPCFANIIGVDILLSD